MSNYSGAFLLLSSPTQLPFSSLLIQTAEIYCNFRLNRKNFNARQKAKQQLRQVSEAVRSDFYSRLLRRSHRRLSLLKNVAFATMRQYVIRIRR